MPYTILVVDDEENIRWVFKKALEKKQYVVHTAQNGEEALEKIRTQDYLIVFSDIFMDGINGLDLLGKVKLLKNPPHIVMMTAQDTMNNTIEAMRRGAYDYVSKPFDFKEIYALIHKAADSKKIKVPNADKNVVFEDPSSGAIIGKSKIMQSIFKTIGKSAISDLALLITGESGTGKEMVARALHHYSRRSDQFFICINCAAISRDLLESELFGHEKGSFTGAMETKKGKFELANNGTLFLDEIGDMEIQLQAKILRVLQNHEFYRVGGKQPLQSNVRIIAATNQNLSDLMNKKLFREDLYHRLNVIHIHLPPLRERPEDVPLLANHFLSRFSDGTGDRKTYLAPETETLLQQYSWPGNIRELENTIKQGIVLAGSGPILKEHLPPSFFVEPDLSQIATSWRAKLESALQDFFKTVPEEGDLHKILIQELEKYLFKIVLDKHFGKQVAAAKALGINRNTLKRKLDSMQTLAKPQKTNSN